MAKAEEVMRWRGPTIWRSSVRREEFMFAGSRILRWAKDREAAHARNQLPPIQLAWT
jgi:hypothetical protein